MTGFCYLKDAVAEQRNQLIKRNQELQKRIEAHRYYFKIL